MSTRRRLIASFIILMPIIDNINGLSIKFFNLSIIGPMYRIIFLILFLLFFLFDKKVSKVEKLKCVLVFNLYILYLLIHVMLNYTQFNLMEFSDYLKFFYPLIIYFPIKNWLLIDKSIEIKRYAIASISLYSFFIILSFIIGFRYYSFKPGYYGFVFALNDLNISYIIASMLFLDGKNNRLLIFNGIALLLTASKMNFIFFPYYLIVYMVTLKKFKFRKIVISIGFIFILVAMFKYSSVYKMFFEQKSYLKNVNMIQLYQDNPRCFYRELSYGRSEDVYSFLDNKYAKNFVEWIIGSGQRGFFYTNFHGGMEMDPLDAINFYGILGLGIYLYFYIFKIQKYMNIKEKMIYILVIVYSFFGGHLYNNPMSGTFYVYLMGYFYLVRIVNGRIIESK